jgi:hypothetical protein
MLVTKVHAVPEDANGPEIDMVGHASHPIEGTMGQAQGGIISWIPSVA